LESAECFSICCSSALLEFAICRPLLRLFSLSYRLVKGVLYSFEFGFIKLLIHKKKKGLLWLKGLRGKTSTGVPGNSDRSRTRARGGPALVLLS
jgi:hypothetical protein